MEVDGIGVSSYERIEIAGRRGANALGGGWAIVYREWGCANE